MIRNQNQVKQNSTKLTYQAFLNCIILFIFASFSIISLHAKTPKCQFEDKNKAKLYKENGQIFLIDSIYGKILLQIPDYKSVDSVNNNIYKGWVLDHYEAVKGKELGIWTYDYSVPFLKTLKEKWGFNFLWLYHDSLFYTNAILAGFNKKNLMVSLDHSPGEITYRKFVDKYESDYYYIDEVAEHNCIGNTNERIYNPGELKEISSYVHKKKPGAKFVISGYKRCTHLITASLYSDLIMYSSYHNWYQPIIPVFCDSGLDWGPRIEALWFKGNDDQRDGWSDMKKRFGDKFQRTWIKTNEGSEFQQLFGHAVNQGINSIWVYNYEDKGKVENYDDICHAAFINGFLRKYEKQIEIKFYNEDTDSSIHNIFSGENNISYMIAETGLKREVFP